MADPAAEKFESHLLHQYGPTISGPDLYEALGFKTYAAFHSCHQRDEIGVNVFKLPSRRGWYALTTDVAAWLLNQARIGGEKSAPEHVAPDDSINTTS